MAKRTKRWGHSETKAFLQFYSARKEEFNNPRKKRLTFANIVEDMISAGFDSNIKVNHLEVKMQTLLKAYKNAKDNNGKTGASPCPSPFINEMDEILGDMPIHSKSESFNYGADCLFIDSEETTTSMPATPLTINDEFTLCDSLHISPLTDIEISALAEEESITEMSALSDEDPVTESFDVASTSSSFDIALASVSSSTPLSFLRTSAMPSSSNPGAALAAGSPNIKRKRNMTRSDFYKERLKRMDLELQKKEEWRNKKLQVMETFLEK